MISGIILVLFSVICLTRGQAPQETPYRFPGYKLGAGSTPYGDAPQFTRRVVTNKYSLKKKSFIKTNLRT